MANSFNSFEDLKNAGIEFSKSVATISHKDENIANNRLFVWNFEAVDLEEFIHYFKIYKGKTINAASRRELSSNIRMKFNSMLQEGYIPIECMLYASKTINSKLSNDSLLQETLAERIRDVYLKKPGSSMDVFNNILDTWSWIPQLKVVITAIGLIGDNQELLDRLLTQYGSDEQLKVTTFYAFLKNKTPENLERSMNMVMNLNAGDEDDELIGRLFRKSFSGFGQSGIEVLDYYEGNPGMSRLGMKVLQNIRRDSGIVSENEDDEGKIDVLAKESRRDDRAYEEFLKVCQRKPSANIAFKARFSRVSIIPDYLEPRLQDYQAKTWEKSNILISMARLGRGNYPKVKAIIKNEMSERGLKYPAIIALMILKDEEAMEQFADVLANNQQYDLHNLYGLLRNAGIASDTEVQSKIQRVLLNKLEDLYRMGDLDRLEIFASNLQCFYSQRAYKLLSEKCLSAINRMLRTYVEEPLSLNENIVISFIEVEMPHYNKSFESVLFDMYRKSPAPHVRNYIFKRLKERNIQAPT